MKSLRVGMRLCLLALSLTPLASALNGPICPIVVGHNVPRTGGDWSITVGNGGLAPVDFGQGQWLLEDTLGGSVSLSTWGVLAVGDAAVVTSMLPNDFNTRWSNVNTPVVGNAVLGLLQSSTVVLTQNGQVIDLLAFTIAPGQDPFPSKYGYLDDLGVGSDANWVEACVGDLFGSTVVAAPNLGFDLVGNPLQWTQLRDLGSVFCAPAGVNSTGVGGQLLALGSDVVANNDLTLHGMCLPLNQFGYFLASLTAIPPMAVGQGNLCLGSPVGRFNAQVGNSGTLGRISVPLDLTNFPPPLPALVQPGDTWCFQLWYRDLNPGPTSNLTEGVCITFL